MAHLALALLGPFEAVLDGKRVTWFQSDKARALLAYLAVEAASPHGRHALAGLLWPDVPDAHALHSLSQALCNLRTVLHDQTAPTPCFIVTPHAIQFNPHCDHWVDVEEFGRLVNWDAAAAGRLVNWGSGKLVDRRDAEPGSADHTTNLPIHLSTNLPIYQSTNLPALQQAVTLYRSPFLEDLTLADGVGFEEWAGIQRERLHRLMLAALRQLVSLHEASRELEAALGCVWRQLELDPWLEEAHFQAMRLLADAGRRSEALHQYHLCRRLLASELGVEPAAATTHLYEQIRDGAREYYVP
jgi:DNA-binding SARP family transcriptional activator